MYINERACSKWPMAIFVTIYTCIEEITDRKSWQMTLSRKFIPDDHDKPCYFYTKGNYLPKKTMF